MFKLLKSLKEQREVKEVEMSKILGLAKSEERAMTEDEIKKFDKLEEEIRAIDKTIKATEKERNAQFTQPKSTTETQEEVEERAFADFILGRVTENRADEQNYSMGNNGAIIPISIADKIIKAVKDICPILAGATIYHAKGKLKVPVYDNTRDIAVGYQTEFTDITADAGKFVSVDLDGYLIGALALIGKSVENNSAFDVVAFVIQHIAEQIAIFLEGELLNGTGTSACQGALNTSTTVTTASATAITADELIALQAKVKQAYQDKACWTMNSETFTTVKQLKDENGRYLLQDNVSNQFPFMLLGKPVNLSDNMPSIAAGAKPILYGDYSGLSVKFSQEVEIQVLREKYATQHAIGAVAWCEVDSKVTNNQKLAVLTMKAS